MPLTLKIYKHYDICWQGYEFKVIDLFQTIVNILFYVLMWQIILKNLSFSNICEDFAKYVHMPFTFYEIYLL